MRSQQAAQKPKLSLTLATPVVDGRHIACSVSAARDATQRRSLRRPVDPAIDTTTSVAARTAVAISITPGVVRILQRIGKVKDLERRPGIVPTLTAPADTSA